MRQRLGIAQAIMEDPQILLLDEPLNGLDNEGVEEMRNVLLKQKDQGKLIIIASHSKEDVDILVFHIGYLKHNTVMAFPSVLVFKEIPDFIDYEISSKYVADVVKGTVEIRK